MRPGLILAVMTMSLSLAGQAAAQGVFVDDARTFSGVANARGEGLIVPQTVIAGGNFGLQTWVANDDFGDFAIVTAVESGVAPSGLMPFPLEAAPQFNLKARLTTDEQLWGGTPYVGVGVNSTSSDSRIFQGISRLLPYEADGYGVQGVAGIAYELMPGIGAGLEYRYQTHTNDASVMSGTGENQTIMMRLDLGLN